MEVDNQIVDARIENNLITPPLPVRTQTPNPPPMIRRGLIPNRPDLPGYAPDLEDYRLPVLASYEIVKFRKRHSIAESNLKSATLKKHRMHI